MKNNTFIDKFRPIYLAGFFIILALPILVIPPYFFPPDFGKTIVFKSIMALLLLLFVFQMLFAKNRPALSNLKKNKIVWALAALFTTYLLSTIFSQDFFFSLWGNPLRSGGFVIFGFYFVFAILAFMFFKNGDWKKAWLFSIIIGVLVSLIAVIQYYGLFSILFAPSPYRPASTMGNPDILAVYLLLLSFIALSFGIKEGFSSNLNKIKKIFYFFSVAVFLYVILISGARAVYLGIALGLLYFFLLYPKKMRVIKIIAVILIILAAGGVFYVSTADHYPKFLEKNRLFESVISRLSLKSLKNDPRFAALQIELNIVKAKPLLGFGPENFSVGFDKYYDPTIPYLNTDIGWWDRAHNILIQTASDAGFLGVLTYLALFITLFWQLHKIKSSENGDNAAIAHGIQATLIGYFVANLFSFDSFSTYLIFFLLIGYTLHLCSSDTITVSINQWKANKKAAVIGIFIIVSGWFLWQYNIVPFFVNAKINQANNLANRRYCGQALSLMDSALPTHSFLDSYIRLKYIELEKTCGNFYPENNLSYKKRGIELIGQAVKIQPLYTRYWIFMGRATTDLAKEEKNADAKNNLLKMANNYFDKALQLAPSHQEIPIGQAEMEIAAGDYKSAKVHAQKCIALNPDLGECYWVLGLTQIYTKDITDANKNMMLANKNLYNTSSQESLGQLADAYYSILDYQNLVVVYKNLIAINPNVSQYHSSLAYFYSKLGDYSQARKEAMEVLRISPESKPNVDAFLKTLPY